MSMLFIFTINSVTDKILPCGTPISCGWESDNDEPTLTLNCRSSRKLDMKMGKRPLKSMSYRSNKMPCFQVVSYASSKSKKTPTAWSRFALASLINVSNDTRWSRVDRFFRNPLWDGVSRPFCSNIQTRRLLTMRSMVLHKQLVKAMGR